MIKKKKRILIIRCGLMGDTIDSTAIVKPLLELYGQDLEIEWVTKPNLELLFKYDFRITPIILRFTNLPLLINIGKLKIILKSFFKPYYAVINLELGKKFINLARFTRSKIKIGLPYKHIPENIKNEHRVHHQLRILKSYYTDINLDGAYPYLIGSNIDICDEYNIKNEYIVICPTNSKFKKENYRGYRAWPLNNWQKLIEKIINHTDLDIVVTGSVDEKNFIEQLNLDNERIHNLCGKTSLPNLVEVMRKSMCTIANDSGSVHVAGVSCQKVISLHGPTPFRETGPYGNGNNKIIEATINMKCSPCFKTEVIKKCPSNLCMINLSPETVFRYVIE